MEDFGSAETDIMDHGTGTQGESRTASEFRSDFLIHRDLPSELTAIGPISMNYAWSWLPGGVDLFRDLAPRLWDECEQNPRLLLKRIDDLILQQWAADTEYVARINSFDAKLREYLSDTPVLSTGFSRQDEGSLKAELKTVAYFCAEYGVHNSLPNYSGGLGILAGDHLKSASDLNVPLVAIGLALSLRLFSPAHSSRRLAGRGLLGCFPVRAGPIDPCSNRMAAG